MSLKKPKAKGGKKVTRTDKKKEAARESSRREQQSDEDDDENDDDELPASPRKTLNAPKTAAPLVQKDEQDSEDPNLTVPIPRYNAMLAVLRNTLYM